jgi:hypothetical protein
MAQGLFRSVMQGRRPAISFSCMAVGGKNEQRQQGQYPAVFSTRVILHCKIANVPSISDDLAMKSVELLRFQEFAGFSPRDDTRLKEARLRSFRYY